MPSECILSPEAAVQCCELCTLQGFVRGGVGLNLSGQVSCVIVALDCWLDGLNLLLVENLLLVHDVCLKLSCMERS